MRQINTLFFVLTFFLFPGVLLSQSDQSIGQWKAYLPYNSGKYVTQSASSVYYASDFSLLEIDKEENTIRRLSKTDGLSDVGIKIVASSPFEEVLVVAYENGNIDLLNEGRIINLPFIKQGAILGDRNIYAISFASSTSAFISTGFGVLELNPQAATFTNDIRTGFPVLDVAVFEGFIYAASEEGIYRARISPDVNLQDFSSSWQLLGPDDGFPAVYSTAMLQEYDDNLYLNIDRKIYSYTSSQLDSFYHNNFFKPLYLSADAEHLLLGVDCLGGCLDKVVVFNKSGQIIVELRGDCVEGSINAIEDEKGQIWLADNAREFRMFKSLDNTSCQRATYEGPQSGNIWDLEVQDGKLWMATGGFNLQKQYLFRSDGFLKLEEGIWTQYNRDTREEMRGENPDPDARGDDLFDIVAVKAHPNENFLYAASWAEGLLEFDLENDKMTLFNENNSSIRGVVGDEERNRIPDIAIDLDGNVWLTNYLAERPFSVLNRTDGNWKSFSSSTCGNSTLVLDIVVDGSNNKWMIINEGGTGLAVFNEGDLNDPNDDQCRLISQSNSNLPINDVNCLAIDQDGDVWVGTQDGVVIFQCGTQVFDAELCPGFLQIVNVGGDNEYLLKGENVKAIAVDGANRKWFGTNNGVFLQSPSGDELFASYNETNSPLFSNNIVDIAIDHSSGEVFIGTENGLQSLRTDATEGGFINSSVKVFPNPVRPEYDGPIAIDGLARDADVKITDISGQLIYETIANGGRAIWDGKDYNGRKAASGVYLVFSTSTSTLDNPDAVIAKILVVN